MAAFNAVNRLARHASEICVFFTVLLSMEVWGVLLKDSTGKPLVKSREISSETLSGASDLTDVCDHVQRKEAYFLIDGGMRPVYALPSEIRDRYIPPEVRDKLQHPPRSWSVRCFRLRALFMHDAGNYWQSISRAVNSIPENFSEVEFPEEVGSAAGCYAWAFEAPEGVRRPLRIIPEIRLPPAYSAVGKELAIYNADSNKTLKVKNSEGDALSELKSGEAALYLPGCSLDGQFEWQEMVSYRPEGILIHTNPLMVEERPVCLVNQGQGRGLIPKYSREGELYIPVDKVCDLIVSKRTNHVRPVVCSNQTNVRNLLLVSRGKSGLSFIFHDASTEHLVAVRVVRDLVEKRVVCYLNETLGNKLDTTESIRSTVIEGLKESCPSQDIVVLYPQEILQKDFVSCGVFTIKAMRFFDNFPSFDKNILKLAGSSKEPAQDKGPALQSRVKYRPVLLSEMPARLLKLYQGNLTQINKSLPQNGLLTKKQLNDPVSGKGVNKESLRAYIARHQKALPKLNQPEVVDFVNMAAFRKRYKYLRQCLQLSCGGQKSLSLEHQTARGEVGSGGEPVVSGKRKAQILATKPKFPKHHRGGSSSETSGSEVLISSLDEKSPAPLAVNIRLNPSSDLLKAPPRKKRRVVRAAKMEEPLTQREKRNLVERQRKQNVVNARQALRATLDKAGLRTLTELTTLISANDYIHRLQRDKIRLEKQIKSRKT